METIEKTRVLDTYNVIADEFDKTRVCIWGCVKKFISQLSVSDRILDAGCGNGKNMKYMIDNGFTDVHGCDFTPNFVSICKTQSLNVIEANILSLPYDNNFFDSVICIAVLHHFYTYQNRINAIKELYRVVKPRGKILITVSSHEYPFCKSRNVVGDNDQDSLIPWNTPQKGKIGDRYYHLFIEKELESLCVNAGINAGHINSFLEHGNWCVIITKN
jgi:SAM-dependent methyltransferase